MISIARRLWLVDSRRINRGSALAWALVLAMGCNGTEPSDPGPDPAPDPAQVAAITAIQPDPPVCQIGVPVTLVARVDDDQAHPLKGIVVVFAVTRGSGSLAGTNSTTGADGVASTSFTCAAPIGPFDGNQVTASVMDAPDKSVVWGLDAFAGPLATVSLFAGAEPGVYVARDSAPVPLGFNTPIYLSGMLVAQGGAGGFDAIIEWAVVAGGGSLAASSTESFSCGGGGPWRPTCVLNSWTLGPSAGVQVIELTSPNNSGFRQRFHLRPVAGPLQITQTPATPLQGIAGTALPTPLEVRVRDGTGTPIPRVSVAFDAFGGSALLPISNPASAPAEHLVVYTDGDGRASAIVVLPTRAGETGGAAGRCPVCAVEAVIGSIATPPDLVTWQATVSAGPVAQLVIINGNGQAGTIGNPLGVPLTVQVADQFLNPVENVTVTWTVTSGGGSLASSTTVSNQEGLSSNTWTLGPSVGTQTVTATVNGAGVTFSAVASGGG